MISNSKLPIVSVGIPTYNRPAGLHSTLECITMQTYKNLEIIVSDNCSPEKETQKVVEKFMRSDRRIRYSRQEENMGPVFNLRCVLENSTGEYFMWAADDDEWEEKFIELCLNKLLQLGNEFIAVTTEAQYFSGDGKFEFFPEGAPFYESNIRDTYERLAYMLDYNYGNLFYSLFRREALFDESVSFFSLLNQVSLNEIPLFLFALVKGQWRVLPEVGFYKRTSETTYAQARWEMEGGRLPNAKGIGYYKRLPCILKNHRLALKDITDIIDMLNIDKTIKQAIKLKAKANIIKHFIYFITRRKAKLF